MRPQSFRNCGSVLRLSLMLSMGLNAVLPSRKQGAPGREDPKNGHFINET